MKTTLNAAMASVLVMALLSSAATRADFNREEQLRGAAGFGAARIAEMQRLLAEGVDPNARDIRGRTAVHLAAAAARSDVRGLGLLLDAGGECCLQDGDGNTPLHHAVSSAMSVAPVRLLLKHGADPNRPNNGGNTPLHFSAKHQDPAIVEALLKAGAEPDRRNRRGNTALHESVTFDVQIGGGVGTGSAGVVRALLKGGAAPDAEDANGKTPLLLLVDDAGESEDTIATMRALLRAGADPNQKGRGGNTLLHLAIENDGQEKKVAALLAVGKADPCIPNAKRYIPIHVARGEGYESIEELLARAGGHDWRCDERALAEAEKKKLEEEAVAKEAGLGMDRATRKRIQQGLAAEGFDPGPADGLFGPRTRAAIRGWQETGGKAATGYLDEASAKALAAVAGGEVEAVAGREAKAREEAEEARRREDERKAREAEERRRAEAEAQRKRARSPGTKLQDCPECPELVVVPGGSIGRAFAVGMYEVTFGEWDACVSEGGCGGYRPNDSGWGRGRRPVMNVNWEDAQAYVEWLSRKTGEAYRLLSESEWEYVARAGTRTAYWWGDEIGRNRANCVRCGSRWDGEQTAPVGSFSANGFGLYDVHGNVWEWVEDCWEEGDCRGRVLRGGSWDGYPRYLRSAFRVRYPTGNRSDDIGFRVARTLN